jgi:hypothetical protein
LEELKAGITRMTGNMGATIVFNNNKVEQSSNQIGTIFYMCHQQSR